LHKESEIAGKQLEKSPLREKRPFYFSRKANVLTMFFSEDNYVNKKIIALLSILLIRFIRLKPRN